MTRSRPTTVECREDGCDQRLIFRRDPLRRNTWVVLEATDRAGDERAGCRVVVDGTAWRPSDLVEHFQTRFEIAEPKARALAQDYPHHRPHHHEPASTTNTEETHR